MRAFWIGCGVVLGVILGDGLVEDLTADRTTDGITITAAPDWCIVPMPERNRPKPDSTGEG